MENKANLTSGTIWKRIVIYAIPIFIGGLLQQLYNVVDAVVVGHLVSNHALGAVGSVGPIMVLMVALFMGLSVGSCVVIANYFGKRDHENLSKAAHTAIVISVIIGVFLTIIGITMTPVFLKLIATPEEIYGDAKIYLQTFFAGMIAFSVYNIGASVLQAVGNTRYPLYFLIVSTVLHIILDIVFVAVFKMGVMGVALSTVLSEVVSASLVLITLFNSKKEYKISFKKLKIDRSQMKRIIGLGLPSAIQNSIVAFSNIFVQSYINAFGADTVAGFAAEGKIEAFMTLPISALALSITTFVSQNLGAGDEKRARKGVYVGGAICIGLITSMIVFALSAFHILCRAFTTDPIILEHAWVFARIFIPGYIFLAIYNIWAAGKRGAGKVKFTMFVAIGCFVVWRQIYLAIITQYTTSVFFVAIGFPIAWCLCATILTIDYFHKNYITANNMTRVHINHLDSANPDFLSFCTKLDDYQNEYVPGRRESGINSLYNSENLHDIFLIYDDKTPVGTAALIAHDAETCEIIRVFSDKKYRNKLLTEIENHAKSVGFKKIIMRTFKTLPDADYDKLGFQTANADNFTHVDKFAAAANLAPYRLYFTKDL